MSGMKNVLRLLPCLIGISGVAWSALGAVPVFERAKSVWPAGRAEEMNSRFVFTAGFDAAAGAKAELKLVAWYSYRVKLNGEFVAFGPARGPKAFFRPDVLPLAAKPGRNALTVEVAGYNVPNFYLMEQPPFLKAEIAVDGKVVAATGIAGEFVARETAGHVVKAPRYSYQRTFAEIYRLPVKGEQPALKLAAAPEPQLIDRLVPYPDYEFDAAMKPVSFAKVGFDEKRKMHVDRSLSLPGRKGSKFKGFPIAELEVNSNFYLQRMTYEDRRPVTADEAAAKAFALRSGESYMFDHGVNDAGFPGCRVKVLKPGRLVLEFDELLDNGEARGIFRYHDCLNAVVWDFSEPGDYEVASFEPYVMRYVTLAATEGGAFEVSAPTFRSYKNPTAKRATFKASDPALEKIFAAASETFRQNAVDVFTDCPSRERAGWNCDAYFTGPVSTLLTGNTTLERVFEETLALPPKFDDIPDGMLPMCYPADHKTDSFIPNWAMWFTLETEEYLRRSGDRTTIERLKPRLLKLADYFAKFRNSDGLLEKLPGWNFVEWSQANKLVQDVNYPANMTWAAALEALDRLYGRPDFAAEAAKMRETIRKQSWTGKWFCDNAVRQKDGTLKLSGECTETCQYYAFFFNTATPETYPELWKTLVDDFGPKRFGANRKTLLSHPEIWPSNAFIGNYLRLKIFERLGMGARILDEAKGFFLYMADRSGTLWEHDSVCASCDHGFASYAAVFLIHSVLGAEIDLLKKTVTLTKTDVNLDSCEATLPVGDETVTVVRTQKGGEVSIGAKVPAGWTVVRK